MASDSSGQRGRSVYLSAGLAIAVIVVLSAFFASGLLVLPRNGPTSTSSFTSTSSNSAVTSSSRSFSSTSSEDTSSSSIPFASDWLTYHYDNNRSGSYGSVLNVGSPSVNWTKSLDGAVYAEPLFFNGLVYVATENNTVYAISASNGVVQWSRNLGPAVNVTLPPYLCNGNTPDILPTVGITGTPVIDPLSNTIYVVPFVSGSGYKLVALNTNTGQPRWSASIDESGFNTTWEEERGSLAIANGMVYVPFGGFSYVCGPPRGWLMAFSLTNNGTQFDYEVPANPEGDIWAAEGPSVDSSGFVYVVSGDSNTTSRTYGNAVIKLTPDLVNVSYFQPPDQALTNVKDIDFGSTGATQLPGHLLFAIGKDGIGYLLNATNLGGIGGELYNATVCGPAGAWGSTSYASGIIYVPCGYGGMTALSLHLGVRPSFSLLWNYPENWAMPAIIAGGVVWNLDQFTGTLFALNPQSGSAIYSPLSLFSKNSLVAHFYTPSVGGGLLYFAGNDTIYAINP